MMMMLLQCLDDGASIGKGCSESQRTQLLPRRMSKKKRTWNHWIDSNPNLKNNNNLEGRGGRGGGGGKEKANDVTYSFCARFWIYDETHT